MTPQPKRRTYKTDRKEVWERSRKTRRVGNIGERWETFKKGKVNIVKWVTQNHFNNTRENTYIGFTTCQALFQALDTPEFILCSQQLCELVTFSILQMRTGGPERLNNLSKITQEVQDWDLDEDFCFFGHLVTWRLRNIHCLVLS